MAHAEQQSFFKSVKRVYPKYFNGSKVLEVGSLDINGSCRTYFENCNYTGIDISEGPGVDVVCLGHEYNEPDETYDVIINTEAAEHDMFYDRTLKNIIRMLKPQGIFLFTCATTNREEHGTLRSHPDTSPLTSKMDATWANYYKNLTEEDIRDVLDIDSIFSDYQFLTARDNADLMFWGIKK